jgi:hypothetical protein
LRREKKLKKKTCELKKKTQFVFRSSSLARLPPRST